MTARRTILIRWLSGILVTLILGGAAVMLFSNFKAARDRQSLDQLFCTNLSDGMSLEQARAAMESAGATGEGTYWLYHMFTFNIDGQTRRFEEGVTFDLPYAVSMPENQTLFFHTALLVVDENRLVWKGYVAGIDHIEEYPCG